MPLYATDRGKLRIGDDWNAIRISLALVKPAAQLVKKLLKSGLGRFRRAGESTADALSAASCRAAEASPDCMKQQVREAGVADERSDALLPEPSAVAENEENVTRVFDERG